MGIHIATRNYLTRTRISRTSITDIGISSIYCLVDRLSVGTGNSLGRLDLRLDGGMSCQQSFVAGRPKDLKGGVLEFRPQAAYLISIVGQPVETLGGLSRQ